MMVIMVRLNSHFHWWEWVINLLLISQKWTKVFVIIITNSDRSTKCLCTRVLVLGRRIILIVQYVEIYLILLPGM